MCREAPPLHLSDLTLYFSFCPGGLYLSLYSNIRTYYVM